MDRQQLKIDTVVDWIGTSMPRPATRRLVRGAGQYLDDLRFPGLLHAAFLRSPYGHARIKNIHRDAAASCQGVFAILTAEELRSVASPWSGNSPRFPSLRSPSQFALASDRVVYQGEPVVLAVAESRALAEDALEHVDIEWEELPVCVDLSVAADPASPLVHPELQSNVALEMITDSGEVDRLFAEASTVVEDRFAFGRHSGTPLETRGIIAKYDAGEDELEIYQSTQVPNQTKIYVAQILNMPAHQVRVIAPDVGGAFGMKMHIYPDEMAVVAAAKYLRRKIKYVCDRLESFASDAHAREHLINAKAAFGPMGELLAFDVDDLFGMGAYSMFPRTGVLEPVGAMRLIGAPYKFQAYRSRMRACYLNKPPSAQYRAVGHPIAVAVTEALMDKAALQMGIDRLEIRRRNYLEPGSVRTTTPAGATVYDMSHTKCQRKLTSLINLPALEAEKHSAQKNGKLLGIGFATYVEMTATGPGQYGQMGIQISASDTVNIALEPSGGVTCSISITDQGQGTTAAIAQIVASAIGVDTASVVVRSGDSATGMGGGAWASRGTAIGGEVAWRGARLLKQNILVAASGLLQCQVEDLRIIAGNIVDAGTENVRMSLQELAEIVYFRASALPKGQIPQLAVTEQYFREDDPSLPTNGIHAAFVEVDAETGLVKLLGHWVVDDCGTIVNPLLLDEQIRGGVVQGLGAALYEELPYSDDGQLQAGTFADYKLPLSSEMPDIFIGHVSTRYSGTNLGAKGGGEAGTCASAAAVLNAVNDAIHETGALITRLPITPARILESIGDSRTGKLLQ